MLGLTRRTALSATPAFLLAPTIASATAGISPEPVEPDGQGAEAEAMRAVCDRLVQQDGFSGVVLLMQAGRIVFQTATGLRNRGDGLANQFDTRFSLASVGKLFTSLAILRLVAAGRLSLEAPLIEAWPDFPNPETARRITVAQLLTHRAGLGNAMLFKSQVGFTAASTQTDYVSLFAGDGFESEPGRDVSYSNDGYVVLAALVERLTGQDFRDHCRTTIFEPLGMHRTGFEPMADIIPNRAIPYARDLSRPGVWQAQISVEAPAPGGYGGGNSTVSDLARFATAMASGQLLDPATSRLWTTTQVPFRQGGYGYGCQTELWNGQHLFGHTGGHYGVAAEVLCFERTGHIFVVLSNGEVEPYWELANFVRVLLAGQTETSNSYAHTRSVAEAARSGGIEAALEAAAAAPDVQLREGMLDTYAFRFWHEGRADAAEALLRFNLSRSPDSLFARWSLGEFYRLSGRPRLAIAAYRRFLELQPGDADALRFIERLEAGGGAP